jgi:HEPN domain-containing protein
MGGVNRKDLQLLAQTRLAKAKALLSVGCPDGAYYLAGYAVECALKACIAKGTERHDFPEKKSVDAGYTHNLKDLIKVANLELARLEDTKADPTFRDNWEMVKEWSEQSRYRRQDSEMARAFIRAIGERKHGVFAWIKRRW